jgi:hypothetical protein
MFVVELLVEVNVIEPGERTFLCFSREVSLPFVPFVGLMIHLDEAANNRFDVNRIIWSHVEQKFYLECEPDCQDNRPWSGLPGTQSIKSIMSYYMDQGWVLVEGDDGPFLKLGEDDELVG